MSVNRYEHLLIGGNTYGLGLIGGNTYACGLSKANLNRPWVTVKIMAEYFNFSTVLAQAVGAVSYLLPGLWLTPPETWPFSEVTPHLTVQIKIENRFPPIHRWKHL